VSAGASRSGWQLPTIAGTFGLLAALVLGWVAWRDDVLGILSDGYVYLLEADAFANLEHGLSPLGRFLFKEYPFPPLYPLVLAAWGAGADTAGRATLVNAGLLGAVTGVLVYWYRRLDLPLTAAVLLAAVFMCLPVTWLTAMDIQSEPLYLLLSVATLLLVSDADDSISRWRLAGACCGLAVVTRSAGVALLGAFLWTWWSSGSSRDRPAAVCALAPGVLWWGLRVALGDHAGYLSSDRAIYLGTLAKVLEIMQTNLRALAELGMRSLDLGAHRHVAIALTFFAVAAVAGLLLRLRAGRCDARYVVCYSVVILLWPYPEHMRRFLFVVLPLLGGYALAACGAGLQRTVAPRFVSLALCSLATTLGLLALPSTASIALGLFGARTSEDRALLRAPSSYLLENPALGRRWVAMTTPIRTLAAEARRLVPGDACLNAVIAEMVMFYVRRPVLDLDVTKGRPEVLATRVTACPYVVMVNFVTYPTNGLPALYPLHVLGTRLEVLAATGDDPHDPTSPVRAMLAHYR
jgi:hypothetical protein